MPFQPGGPGAEEPAYMGSTAPRRWLARARAVAASLRHVHIAVRVATGRTTPRLTRHEPLPDPTAALPQVVVPASARPTPMLAPIVPRLGAVGAGRSVGHAIAAARDAAERRFLGGDPRAAAARGPDQPSGAAAVIDPRHPAAHQPWSGDDDGAEPAAGEGQAG